VEFKVVEIDPPEYGIVGPATVIYTGRYRRFYSFSTDKLVQTRK